MSAILGKNPRLSAFDAWALLTGRVDDGFSGGLPDYMQTGLDFEKPILARYAREFEATDLRIMGDELVMHPDIPFIGGHPDGDRPEASIVPDAKTVLPWMAWKWGPTGTDKVPIEVLIQMVTYMSILRRDGAHVPTLIAGHDWRVFEIPRNLRLETAVLDRAWQFWKNHVKADIPPEIRPTATAERFLKTQFPRGEEPLRPAKLDEVSLAGELAVLKGKMKKLAGRAEQIETVLKLTIGKAEGIEAPDFRILYRGGEPKAKTDWEKVARKANASPALVKEFTKVQAGPRRFTPGGMIFKGSEEE